MTENSGILAQLPKESTVVIIRLRSLGDTVLTTPSLALLRSARPDLRVCVVVERPFDALLEGNPDVSRIVAVRREGGFGEKFRALRAIRAEKPHLCLNLHGGATSAWLTGLSGARFRAGYRHFTPKAAYNVLIPRAQEVLRRGPEESVHTAEHHASAIFFLGAPVCETPRAVLRAQPRPRQTPYAVMHVTAAYFTKTWPAERYREIAQYLQTKHELEPIIIAGPGESAALDALRGFSCLDKLDLHELKSLVAGARLFVGNDSGPAHVAAAFGVPSLVIFGSSNSRVWGPWKNPHEVVETQWDCKPCPGDRCYAFDEPRCILSVEASAVQMAIDRLLLKRSGASQAGIAARHED